MKLVAITGSIGCGKTTIAKMVRSLGYCVYDVDGWVRRLYFKKDFIKVIAQHFPEVMEDGKVNKRVLRNIVFNDNNKLKLLESLIHPFLKKTLKNIIHKNAQSDDIYFLDVALLFEMGWDIYCDCIIVADVDYETQKQRVMERDNITADDFDKINNIQMDNKAKVLLSDVVIETDRPCNMILMDLISLADGLEEDGKRNCI